MAPSEIRVTIEKRGENGEEAGDAECGGGGGGGGGRGRAKRRETKFQAQLAHSLTLMKANDE